MDLLGLAQAGAAEWWRHWLNESLQEYKCRVTLSFSCRICSTMWFRGVSIQDRHFFIWVAGFLRITFVSAGLHSSGIVARCNRRALYPCLYLALGRIHPDTKSHCFHGEWESLETAARPTPWRLPTKHLAKKKYTSFVQPQPATFHNWILFLWGFGLGPSPQPRRLEVRGVAAAARLHCEPVPGRRDTDWVWHCVLQARRSLSFTLFFNSKTEKKPHTKWKTPSLQLPPGSSPSTSILFLLSFFYWD